MTILFCIVYINIIYTYICCKLTKLFIGPVIVALFYIIKLGNPSLSNNLSGSAKYLHIKVKLGATNIKFQKLYYMDGFLLCP